MVATPRVTLHIGSHKTGTTYLQSVFQVLTPALREKGVLVPTCWSRKAGQVGHHALARLLIGEDRQQLARDMRSLRDTGCPDILVSSEWLNGLNQQQISLLKEVLGDADVRIVFHCRRWSELLPSSWQTLIRGGAVVTWPAFYRRIFTDAGEQPTTNFSMQLEGYAHAFGHQAISIVSYNNVMDARDNLAAHFFTTFYPEIGDVFDDDVRDSIPARNVSLPYWQTELLRGLNVLAADTGPSQAWSMRAWFLRKGRLTDLREIETLLTSRRQVVRIDDTNRKYALLHRQLFRRWGDRLVNPLAPEQLFAPRVNDVEFVHPKAMQDPAVDDLLRTLWADYRATADRQAVPVGAI